MVRDSLEAHKDRHAPLLRRFGAALLWRFVVGESAGEVCPLTPVPPYTPLHVMMPFVKRAPRLASLARGSTPNSPLPQVPSSDHVFPAPYPRAQPAAALRALRVREQPSLFEPLLCRHVHALYLAQWGEMDVDAQPQVTT